MGAFFIGNPDWRDCYFHRVGAVVSRIGFPGNRVDTGAVVVRADTFSLMDVDNVGCDAR